MRVICVDNITPNSLGFPPNGLVKGRIYTVIDHFVSPYHVRGYILAEITSIPAYVGYHVWRFRPIVEGKKTDISELKKLLKTTELVD